MPALPPPVRAVAGLAARTLDEARRLPQRMISLPVRMAGAAMQASLRVQQEYAGLVARGDELLVRFGAGNDDSPPWATFDEPAVTTIGAADLGAPVVPPAATPPLTEQPPPPVAARRRRPRADLGRAGHGAGRAAVTPFLTPRAEESAFDEMLAAHPLTPEPAPEPVAPVGTTEPVAGYDDWTVPQLRARLRRMSVSQLADLLAYEGATQARAAYLTMLQNRLVAVGTD